MKQRDYFFCGLLLFFLSNSAWSIECVLTAVKGNCWKDYTVHVLATDAASRKDLATAVVWEDSLYARKKFPCSPGQKLFFKATFSPLIWEKDKDKVYVSEHFMQLPAQVNKGTTLWDITVCFPDRFAGVPVPPTNDGNCPCEPDKVPPLTAEYK